MLVRMKLGLPRLANPPEDLDAAAWRSARKPFLRVGRAAAAAFRAGAAASEAIMVSIRPAAPKIGLIRADSWMAALPILWWYQIVMAHG